MRHTLCTLLGLLLATALYGQQKDSSWLEQLSITGYGGVYYRYGFNENETDNKTSFTDAHNTFAPGMFSVKMQHQAGKVGFTADLGFGQRADAFSYNDQGSAVALKQLFIDYRPLSWLTLTMGSFATYIGYELVDADQNGNYSMSYLFSYGPFFHTGVKAAATAGAHSWMVGLFNPPDQKYAVFDSRKYLGAQWAYQPKAIPLAVFLNYLGGNDTTGLRSDQLDLVVSADLNTRFSLGYEGSVSRYADQGTASHWWGTALYVKMKGPAHWDWTLRSEFFNDRRRLKVFMDADQFPEGGTIWAFTLSARYHLGPLLLIPELRLDHATAPVFHRKGQPEKDSPAVLLAAVYRF